MPTLSVRALVAEEDDTFAEGACKPSRFLSSLTAFEPDEVEESVPLMGPLLRTGRQSFRTARSNSRRTAGSATRSIARIFLA